MQEGLGFRVESSALSRFNLTLSTELNAIPALKQFGDGAIASQGMH